MEKDAREFLVHVPHDKVEEFLKHLEEDEGEILEQRDRLVTPWQESRAKLVGRINYARANLNDPQISDGFSALKGASIEFVFRVSQMRNSEDVSEFISLTFTEEFPIKILATFEEALEEIEREYGNKPWIAVGLIRPIHALFDYFGLNGQERPKTRREFERKHGQDSVGRALGWLEGRFLRMM